MHEVNQKLTYLAVPYSHPDEAVQLDRFNKVNKVAARLMKEGEMIYSPISQSHPIALAGGLPTDWNYWEAFDRLILGLCGKLIVLMLPGWKESVGVTAEIAIATEFGLPIQYLLE